MKLLSAGLFGALLSANIANASKRPLVVKNIVPDASITSQQLRGQRKLQTPIQTYYVPLPEDPLLETFETISPNDVLGPIETLISITIAVNGTIIWYDHWEDGYEEVATTMTQDSTVIWGDGNKANGCPPSINGIPKVCNSDEDDILSAGNAIVLQNRVTVPRNPNDVFFDGSDRIKSSFPIAVTRGAFPRVPGSLIAGAVEVADTDSWGTQFEAPVGTETNSSTAAFEYTALYVMARQDDTTVTLPDGSTSGLSKGENLIVLNVIQGEEISADKPVQVDLLVGDIGSDYELRWYSLLPTSKWSTEYYTPVGDTLGGTKVWVYNPGNDQLDISYTFGDGSTGVISLGARKAKSSPVVPTGSGAKFIARQSFFALTQTDTVIRPQEYHSGKFTDWGHPLVPRNQMTNQALVGLGYGCTDNDCGSDYEPRSVVWVTPVADATLFVDYDSDGIVDEERSATALESVTFYDSADKDMTGALIYALDSNGNSVDIAAAWGQKPNAVSKEAFNLDMGILILPLPILSSEKSAVLLDDKDGSGSISPGDRLRYTIAVANTGQRDYSTGEWTLLDDFELFFKYTTYVPNSTVYNDGEKTFSIADDSSNSAFPLDENGLPSPSPLKRNSVHEVSFEVDINIMESLPSEIENRGVIKKTSTGTTISTFEVVTPLRGSIGDTVFLDSNRNGLQDVNETGIPGVTVSLRDDTGSVIAQAETDENGKYTFVGLVRGTYTVGVDETTTGLASPVLTTESNPYTVTLQAGEKFVDADFGFYDEGKTRTGAPEGECKISVNPLGCVRPLSSVNSLCDDKLKATTLKYTGPDISGHVKITFTTDSSCGSDVVYELAGGVFNGTVLTSQNENGYTVECEAGKFPSKTTITVEGGGRTYVEIIHTSCSAVYYAGMPAPLDANSPNPMNPTNPTKPTKGDPSPYWFVVDFIQVNDREVSSGPRNPCTVSKKQCMGNNKKSGKKNKSSSSAGIEGLNLKVTGDSCSDSQNSNMQGTSGYSCTDVKPLSDVPRVNVKVEGSDGGVLTQGDVPLDGTISLTSSQVANQDSLLFTISSTEDQTMVYQTVKFSVACSASALLHLFDNFGAIQVTGWTNSVQGVINAETAVTTFQYEVQNTGTTSIDITSVEIDNISSGIWADTPKVVDTDFPRTVPAGAVTTISIEGSIDSRESRGEAVVTVSAGLCKDSGIILINSS